MIAIVHGVIAVVGFLLGIALYKRWIGPKLYPDLYPPTEERK